MHLGVLVFQFMFFLYITLIWFEFGLIISCFGSKNLRFLVIHLDVETMRLCYVLFCFCFLFFNPFGWRNLWFVEKVSSIVVFKVRYSNTSSGREKVNQTEKKKSFKWHILDCTIGFSLKFFKNDACRSLIIRFC